MPVPGTQEIRKPLLEAFKDEAPHNFVINEFLSIIAAKFGENLDDMSSTEKTALKNNINEAKSFLRKHKLLSHPSKNTYMITRAGSKLLEDNPEIIDDDYFNPKPKEEKLEVQEQKIIKEENPAGNFLVEEDKEQEAEIPVDFSEQEFLNAPEEIIEEPENEITEEKIPAQESLIEEQEPEQNTEIPVDFSEQEFLDTPEEIIEEPENENEIEIKENEEFEEIDDDPIDTEEDFEKNLDVESEELEMPEEEISNSSDVNETENINIEEILEKYNSKLADEVLERAANLSPDMFCMLIMDLLSKMGYRAFQTARYTNDAEGSDLIHGVILENKAGMMPIYVHARKLSPSRTVGKSDMIDFIDAIADKGGKGIFATTGTFSEQAEISANDEKIMLLDGKKLASLMIAHNFCVNVEKIFELKAIDSESFSEYEG